MFAPRKGARGGRRTIAFATVHRQTQRGTARLAAADDLQPFLGGVLLAVLGAGGQLERERGAAVGAVAGREQAAAELASGERRAVQAEAVALAAGGEAVLENAGEVLRRDAHAVVADHEAE